MKHKKDKTESIVFSNDESAEILFEKIKGWEISSQVEFIVSFDNPKRKELFEKIFEAVTNETVKQNISLIVQRIEQAGFQVSGYNPSEIEYYQSLFAKDFYTVLHSETYQTYIEDKIRELHFYCKRLEQDLQTNQYEFLEDKEQDENQIAEAERYKLYLESFIIHLKNPAPQKAKTKTEQETPKTFEELFYNPEHAEPCLRILSELQPPVIDAINNFIGKAKGVFPLWVKVLKNHKPEPLIKHYKDTVYKDLLNNKVKGLNLTKDASEFRKRYVRLENDNTELDIKTILSQYSQSGKLGK
jgi:hypothetical protein